MICSLPVRNCHRCHDLGATITTPLVARLRTPSGKCPDAMFQNCNIAELRFPGLSEAS